MNPRQPRNPKAPEDMEFEDCFKELEQLVERFEQGHMALTESVVCFERGMQLLKRCSTQLADAEKRVSELLSKISPQDIEMIKNTPEGDPNS